MNNRITVRRLSGITALGAGAMMATAAFGAPTDSTASTEELTEIVVTGTLIKGAAPIGVELTTVSREDIVNLGVVSSQDLLSTMPQVTSAFNSVQNPNTGVSGLTIVRPNIHNIGAAGGNTTLVLIDGHDVVGAGILQTTPDAGVLPPNILQNVDVIADGGSAIYGADAVGGIVNFVTRKKMEGVEVDAHYGRASEYGAGDFNLAAGHDWGTGSALLSASFRGNDDLTGTQRPYYTTNLAPLGGTDHRVATCFNSNVSANGVNYALPGLVANTQNLCDPDRYNDLFPREDQKSVFGNVTQELSSNVTFDVTGYYTNRHTDRYGAQISSTGTINNTNPYFIPVGGATSETVQYSYASAAGNTFTSRTSISEGGVTPELKFKLGGDWDLTTMLNFGRSTTTSRSPEINSAADSAALAGTTLATALDPYNVAATSAAVLAPILQYEQYATNTQDLYEAKAVAQGTVVSLPGGNARLAVGAQYEYESIAAQQLDGPDGSTAGAATAASNLKSTSVFGEMRVPIVGKPNEFAGVRALDVDLSVRYDHYNIFGGTTNPKFGLNWKPIDDLTLRGSYGTSFVAPSLSDLSGSVDFRAQVIPVSPFGPGAFNLRPTILLAGGGQVNPMTSKNYTFGVDYSPEWLQASTFSLTYWHTEVDHLINVFPFFAGAYYFNTFPNAYVINPTLAQAQALIGNERIQGPSLASLYSNPATTPYAILDAERTNLGNQYLEGLDFNFSYKHQMSFGSLFGLIAGTYVLSDQSEALGSTTRSSLFEAGNNISRLLMTTQAGAVVGAFTSRVTLNYSSGFAAAVPGQTTVGAFYPVNLTFAYNFGALIGFTDLATTLNINNVFDKEPAFENITGSANTADGTGNGATVGRFFNLGVHAKF